MAYLQRLIDRAREEDWEFIDYMIPQISGEMEYVRWASSDGIRDSNAHIRDLAVSIIEKSNIPEDEFTATMKGKLYALMRSDDNRYVRFRAAFALVNHGVIEDNEVTEKLNEALMNKDVSKIASKYLEKIKNQKSPK
jgi:hypothetical protein